MRSRKLVVFTCTAIAYSSVAVLAYVATFLRRFGAMWPEMFCYDPAPEYFQLNIAVPIVILGGALVLCGATRAGTFERQPGAVIIFVAGSGWALQIIATVIHRLASVSYDSGCGRGEEWFGTTAPLEAFTTPYGGYAICSVLFVLTTVTLIREVRAA